jgi:formate dehydrogenase major subunit
VESCKVRINGCEVEAPPGMTILDVVRKYALDEIPTLCHSPELEPYASCFLCVVEVKGRPNLLPSCATRIAPGMEIETRNRRVAAARKTALELLLSNHYADCLPPCRLACPAGVDTQGYLALSAMGCYREAVDLIRQANPLPAVCARVCVRKCEIDCRRADVDSPVGINAVKRYVTDAPDVYSGGPECAPPTGRRVAIVGGGPAGLTAAWFLGRMGHQAVIYESMEKAGGMLRYGIPAYRLPDEVLDREVEYICRTGAELRTGVRVGKDIAFEELRRTHDAVFLAAGAWATNPMGVEGEFDTEGVVPGLGFLRDRAVDRKSLNGVVVVVGGGNTAVDVARTAWRLGADKVIILYRRTRAEMPADKVEVDDCLAEGIELMELAAPVGIVSEGGRLKALRCIRMKLGEPDASGRRRPVRLEGSEFDLPCRVAVSAIGQAPLLDGITDAADAQLALTRWKTIAVDTGTLSTNLEGVFAGGDAADDGPTVVIDAIRDGQQAARSIHAYLTGAERGGPPFLVAKASWGKPGKTEIGDVKESSRHEVHHIAVEDRWCNFREVATGFEPEDNVHESARCLSCGCVKYVRCELRRYAADYGVDMQRFRGYIRKHKVDDRHPYILYDPNKCILCARCIRTCGRVLPLSALGLIGRGFRTEVRPAMNDPLVETSCVSCGNCIDACPTGALTARHAFPGQAALETTDVQSHCAFCSIGCPITVRRYGENRYFVGPSGAPGEYLCRYGRFGVELFIRRNRITTPLLKTAGGLKEVELTDACRKISEATRALLARHGPESVGVFVSPELTNEELYLAGRVAREGLGTGNIGSLSILAVGREAGALDTSLGFTASSADRSVLSDADLVVCNNTNLEADHLVLAADVIAAVRRGAQLIVAASALAPADQALAALAMDPMRGRGALLWNGILQMLVADGRFESGAIAAMAGGSESPHRQVTDTKSVARQTGVDERLIRRAASMIRECSRIVFVHGPDTTRDRASGDIETFANFVLLLRAAGVRADLLLPRPIGNGAGLEVTGADPSFLAGRRPAGGHPGARSHGELRRILTEGRLRAAIILGEDPMRHDVAASWFRNLEFLAAMDFTHTETTRAADVVLPGTTYLESEGTRCNFEGRVLRFARAIEPPSGVPGWRVLAELAQALGMAVSAESAADLTSEIGAIAGRHLDGLLPFYWNTGQNRTWAHQARLAPVALDGSPACPALALTQGERYKQSTRELGTERYRVL